VDVSEFELLLRGFAGPLEQCVVRVDVVNFFVSVGTHHLITNTAEI